MQVLMRQGMAGEPSHFQNLRITIVMRNFAFQSEQSLRPSKIRQSVSKCFRKLDGLKRFASIQTVLDTANKNKIDHDTIIRAVLDGTADSLLASVLV